MSARVVWRPRAHLDVADTASVFAARSTRTAGRFLDSVQKACELLQDHPFAGAIVPRLSNAQREIRRWAVPGFRSYLLFYIASTGEVEIVRVVYGARNLAPDLLDECPETDATET